MSERDIIHTLIQLMLEFNQPFSKQEFTQKVKQRGFIIENIQGVIEHFLKGKTLVAEGEKYKVNVQPLFR